jgi:hypothetical protein
MATIVPWSTGRTEIGFYRENRVRFNNEDRSLIDPDHVFNRDRDRDEYFSFKG